jgi:hypothetical protein
MNSLSSSFLFKLSRRTETFRLIFIYINILDLIGEAYILFLLLAIIIMYKLS